MAQLLGGLVAVIGEVAFPAFGVLVGAVLGSAVVEGARRRARRQRLFVKLGDLIVELEVDRDATPEERERLIDELRQTLSGIDRDPDGDPGSGPFKTILEYAGNVDLEAPTAATAR